jgi:quercetin dioxygenase-like cupin family protein
VEVQETYVRPFDRGRVTPYRKWQAAEGVPVYEGSHADLRSLETGPWSRMGQRGAIVNLAGQEHDDGWLIELAPGGQTEALHHFFEATIIVLEGRGATTLWNPGGEKQTVEWQRGSLFSPPLNCHYQHFNLDGSQPARLFAVTIAPMVLNLYRSADAVFNNPYVFLDRYAGESDYFSGPGEYISQTWKTNFVPDLRRFALKAGPERGLGALSIRFNLANNQMGTHCSEFPPGTYKQAHRHGAGAHVIILDGDGYSLLWFEGETERRRVDWRDGTVLSPMEGEYHQHFNTGPVPARYLALRLGNLDFHRPPPGTGWNTEQEMAGIAYADEDPGIYDLYLRECARHGAAVVLPRPSYEIRY